MKKAHSLLRATLVAFAVFAAGASTNALAQAPVVKQSAGRFDILTYTAPVPAGWQAQPPTSNYRAAQYQVPAAKGADPGEVVVFYFGKGRGGSIAENTGRWVSQFTTPDGKPVAPKIETLKVAGMTVTTVELHGTYARGVGMGQQGTVKPNQTLLAAIIETPDGNVTFHIYGDRDTVAMHRKGFQSLIRGFKKAG